MYVVYAQDKVQRVLVQQLASDRECRYNQSVPGRRVVLPLTLGFRKEGDVVLGGEVLLWC